MDYWSSGVVAPDAAAVLSGSDALSWPEAWSWPADSVPASACLGASPCVPGSKAGTDGLCTVAAGGRHPTGEGWALLQLVGAKSSTYAPDGTCTRLSVLQIAGFGTASLP